VSPKKTQDKDRISLAGWMVVLTSAYCTALYGSAITVAGAVLPQIQGDLSASLDQISWIVTASIVAGAIGSPPTPWLAARFGIKPLMVGCVVGVTISSALIGTAGTLGEMIVWRICQAILSAPIIALTQTMVLATFPLSRRGLGLSIWTIGITGGWVLGPSLGTLLVEWGSWRVAFLAFGPLGLVGVVLCVAFLPPSAKNDKLEFDWFGFTTLAIALASIQFVLNRGQRLDWYDSSEIMIATVSATVGIYLFVIHSISTHKPFLNWAVFRDRNLVVGMLLLMAYAYISLAPLILIPTMLQNLRGFELLTIGLLLIPRGLAQIATTILIGPLIDRVDLRILIGLGLIGFAFGSWLMAGFNLEIGVGHLLVPTIIQGISMALIAVPTLSISYATLAPELRTDGATIVGLGYTLASSMGVAISIVVLTRTSQTNRAEFAAHITPGNELLRFPEYASAWDLDVLANMAAIQGAINQQAAMVAYVNVYWMIALLCVGTLPLLLLVGKKT
jgi:DHA2 family multidrug resistance protein